MSGIENDNEVRYNLKYKQLKLKKKGPSYKLQGKKANLD